MTSLCPVTPQRIRLMLENFGLDSELHEFERAIQIRVLREDLIYVILNKEDRLKNSENHFKAFSLLSRYGTTESKEVELLHLINKFNKETRFTRAWVYHENNVLVCPIEMECLCVDGATDNMLVEYFAIFSASAAAYAKRVAELIYNSDGNRPLN